MSAVRLGSCTFGILSTMLLVACLSQANDPVWCKLPDETRSDLNAPPVALHLELRSSHPLNGTVIVEQCVDETGHLAREPRVVDSSHVAAVDAAALEYARQQQFLPARRAGHAVPGCCVVTIGMTARKSPD
jgi:TonB family protein